jgi:hypothetical protein
MLHIVRRLFSLGLKFSCGLIPFNIHTYIGALLFHANYYRYRIQAVLFVSCKIHGESTVVEKIYRLLFSFVLLYLIIFHQALLHTV